MADLVFALLLCLKSQLRKKPDLKTPASWSTIFGMLHSIKRFFESYLVPDTQTAGRDPQQAARLAGAALLLEVADSDYQRSPDEKKAVVAAIRKGFGINAPQAEELIGLAAAEQADATDYFQFTSLINRTYSKEQKTQLIEALWQVAFADKEIHKFEEHLVRRLADLLHVPHSDFIAAKHRVLKSD